jgi:hypothetical protein
MAHAVRSFQHLTLRSRGTLRRQAGFAPLSFDVDQLGAAALDRFEPASFGRAHEARIPGAARYAEWSPTNCSRKASIERAGNWHAPLRHRYA